MNRTRVFFINIPFEYFDLKRVLLIGHGDKKFIYFLRFINPLIVALFLHNTLHAQLVHFVGFQIAVRLHLVGVINCPYRQGGIKGIVWISIGASKFAFVCMSFSNPSAMVLMTCASPPPVGQPSAVGKSMGRPCNDFELLYHWGGTILCINKVLRGRVYPKAVKLTLTYF